MADSFDISDGEEGIDRAVDDSKYDVFLSCPMAGFENDATYSNFRLKMLDVKRALQLFCGVDRIYFPAEEIPTMREFDNNFVATRVELESVRRSRIFMMIYPDRIVSSVLFQAGYAFGLGKLSLHFAAKSRLPFLMQELGHLPRNFPQVRLYDCNNVDDIVKILEKNGPGFLL